jgi:hypothetical protein
VDSWKLPESEAVLDSDFSTTAVVFDDANGRKLVAAINKNGDAYAFNRNNLAAGPVWERNIAIGDDCPTCGATSVSSPTFHQGTVFFSGAGGVINGVTYKGTVRAVNPVTGQYIWQHGTTGSVIPALASANGIIYDSAGSVLEALRATTGERLFSYDTGSQVFAPVAIANGMLFSGNMSGNVYAFGLGNPTTPPADPNCPAGWTCQDVGNPQPAGSETNNNGTWTIQAGGAGAGGNADSFRMITKEVSGDVQASAQVTAKTANQAGVMLRQDNTAGSPYFAAFLTPNNGLSIQYRKAYGGATTVLNNSNIPGLPRYIAVQRVDDVLQVATSTDGATFTIVPGSTTTFALPTKLLAGVAVSSTNNGTQASATVNNVVAGAATTFQPQPTAHACPAGWSCQDIGNPPLVGDQTVNNGTYTVNGAGDDILGF